jgi:hypothetical protein
MKLDPDQQAFLKLWYTHVHNQPCLACGSFVTIEAAHLSVFPSRKTRGQMQPRSHKTEAAFACIPLCSDHHKAQHQISEHTWLEQNIPGGLIGAVGWIAREAFNLEWREP